MGLRIKIAYTLAACLLQGFFISSPALALDMPNFSNDGIEAQVRVTFADAPEMIAVANCESGFREYANSGSVLRGGTGGNYIGVFQIGAGHAQDAQSLGFDIYTTDGNIGYARHMYNTSGTTPWSGCVSHTVMPAVSLEPVAQPLAATTLPATIGILTQNLQFGMVNPQVLILQQLLNSLGFTIATEGAGSPGNETTKFGLLTREAVKKFQCAKLNICSGSESDTGYGRVGPKTRAALSISN